MSAINSPFRYAGGKFYARKLIAEHLTDSDVYCEPFAGGGSIFFYKEKSRVNVLNDLDQNLMLVYRTIRDRPEELTARLREAGFGQIKVFGDRTFEPPKPDEMRIHFLAVRE